MNFLVAFLLVELLCVVGVWADYYLKLSGNTELFVQPRHFLVGFVLHASTAAGWFLVLKYMTMTQVGVIYSVSIVLMLTFIGTYFFGEILGGREILGIILAVTSLLLLSKFN